MGDSMSTIINATTTNGVVIQPDNSGSLVLQTNSGTTALTIDTSQNVGIGNTGPSNKLDVTGAKANADNDSLGQMIVRDTTAYNSTPIAGIQFALKYNTAGTYAVGNSIQGFKENATDGNFAQALRFTTQANGDSPKERMRIDSSGNLLIGSTTSTGKLRIKQSADAYSGAIILENFGNTNYWGFQIGSDNNLYYGYNNTTKCSFNNSTGAFAALSDANLKENVINYTNALDKVNLLRPVTYNFIDDKNKYNQIGLIAQEVLNVIPEIVAKPANEDGYYGLNYAGLTPILVKAIQEQQAIINDLKARIETLEAK